MESPTLSLSRSPSSHFAPGSHRRSHPNISHLSLVPLTPKYPIDPADYDAYFDPSTSELHSSASISHISGLPSPGGILTNSPARSRANSRTRLKKKTKSTVSIRAPTDVPPLSTPADAFSSEGFGIRKSHIPLRRVDSSWLVQTGLALTEGSRETKGQSWIGKRDSSTSLVNLRTTAEERQFRSGRTTPNRSRPSSRRRSRRDLAMTTSATSVTAMPGIEQVSPDWADKETQAEIAAQVEIELAEEFDVDQDDPYGMLNFEEHFDSEDEEEVRQEITGYGIGKWMDGIVDVFLQLEEDIPDTVETDLEEGREVQVPPKLARKKNVNASAMVADGPVEPPPERPKGLWDDVAWFGRLVVRTVRS